MKKSIHILLSIIILSTISLIILPKNKQISADCNPLTDPYCAPATPTPAPTGVGPTPTPGVCSDGADESPTNLCSWPNCNGCYCIRGYDSSGNPINGCGCTPGDPSCGTKVCHRESWCNSPPPPPPPPVANQVCGYIKDINTGYGIAGITVYVQDGNSPAQYELVNTDANGLFRSTNVVQAGEYYAVRPRNWSIPSGYIAPFSSYEVGWTWNYYYSMDTPYGSTSYEVQRINSNDCSGPDSSGRICRCSFSLQIPSPTATFTPTPTYTPTPTPNPAPVSSLNCTADSNGDCNWPPLNQIYTEDTTIRLTVGATDTAPPANALQTAYFQYSKDGAGYVNVSGWPKAISGTIFSTTQNYIGSRGSNYRFRTRALDRGGLYSTWVYSDNVWINSYINGNFYLDNDDVGPSGNACVQSVGVPQPVNPAAGSSIEAQYGANPAESGTISGSTYSITTTNTGNHNITLTLPTPAPAATSAYACGCRAIDDFTCFYPNISSPSSNIDFFLEDVIIGNEGWWQALGSNAYAQNSITTHVPDPVSLCEDDETEPYCQPGLMSNYPDSNSESAGFPFVGIGSITTSDAGTFVHPAGSRSSADGAAASEVTIAERGYSTFFEALGGDADTGAINIPGLGAGETKIYSTGDVNIDDTTTADWTVTGGKKVIVFVNGNLNIDDDPAGGTKLTSIEEGSFLAFIVSGSINISENVGHTDPETDPYDDANHNLEGVFVADGFINVNNDDPDTSDKKFIAAGTFVGWSGVNLSRDFDDIALGAAYNNTNPAEVFIYRPDLVISMPIQLKTAILSRQEIEPIEIEADVLPAGNDGNNFNIDPTATPVPYPTNTPVPPTNTPIPPTNTPVPTNTPAPPTKTPTPTLRLEATITLKPTDFQFDSDLITGKCTGTYYCSQGFPECVCIPDKDVCYWQCSGGIQYY